MLRAPAAVICALLFTASAHAQRAARSPQPTRADFEAAVLDRAASEIPPRPCESGEPQGRPTPARALTRDERVRMLGRRIALPDGRSAAVVRTARGEEDANGGLAFALALVVLERGSAAWSTASVTALDTGGAPFEYTEPTVVVARLEDLDDDGEQELLVVLDTDTEVMCGTGYCTERRTVIVEVGERAAPVVASLVTRRSCEAEGMETQTGSVLFRDVDGDGHRDLAHRVRHCPEASVDGEGELVRPACEPREAIHLWRAATDRYAPR